LHSRLFHSLVGFLLLSVLAGCAKPRYVVYRRLTGTCEGACDYYLACKRSDDDTARQACVAECREIFATAETLKDFERLDCEDAIAFVEGSSGRGPGEPLRDK
jgi:hypothetical protein